jgi:hypothetical protein
VTGPPGPGTRADHEANRGDPVMTSHMKDRKPWVLAAVTGVRPLIIALVAVWVVAAVFAALGALTLLGRAGAAISAAPALKLPFAAIPRPLPRRKELLCQTRL